MEGHLEKSAFDFELRSKEDSKSFDSPITGVKIVHSRDEAFERFDELDEHNGRVQFVLRDSPWFLPPIPQAAQTPTYEQPEVSHDSELRKALLLIDSGDYTLAKNILFHILNSDPCHADALKWVGWCEFQLRDYEQSEVCYEQLSILRGDSRDLYEYGEVLYKTKKYDEALQIWFQASRQIEAEDPLIFDLFKNIGNAFTHLGDFESAEENFNKALALRPESDVIQVNLGTLYFQSGDLERSREAFVRAGDLNPANDLAWCGLALLYKHQSDDEMACSLLLKALDINPRSVNALHILVGWAQEMGSYDTAVARVTDYLHINPKDYDFQYVLSGLLVQKGSLKEAEQRLQLLTTTEKAPEAFELLNIVRERIVANE